MKKTERHQIKRDDLVTVIERGTFYVEHHARRMTIMAGAIVVLAAAVFGGRLWWTGRGPNGYHRPLSGTPGVGRSRGRDPLRAAGRPVAGRACSSGG